MHDTVYFQGLTVPAHIGVTEAERREAQTLRIDIEVACDTTHPAASDAIEQAVDYHAIVRAVTAHVEASKCHLLETLAEGIATLVRRDFSVPWVFVKIGKPDILDDVDEVGVAIERGSR